MRNIAPVIATPLGLTEVVISSAVAMVRNCPSLYLEGTPSWKLWRNRASVCSGSEPGVLEKGRAMIGQGLECCGDR